MIEKIFEVVKKIIKFGKSFFNRIFVSTQEYNLLEDKKLLQLQIKAEKIPAICKNLLSLDR